MKGVQPQINQGSLAFIVLIAGIVGGLLIVFSILFLCKYCLNRKNLREAEQMKLLYQALNQVSLIDSNSPHNGGIREFYPLEPRRSNPLDRYQIPYNQRQVPSLKPVKTSNHSVGNSASTNQASHENRENTGNEQYDSHACTKTIINNEQAYLQVDPRCYVRQNSNISLDTHRNSITPRLEKGHSINVDTRPSISSTSSSTYRQSSFDASSCHASQQYQSALSPSTSTQQEIYYTPRGSSLSVLASQHSTGSASPQHLSPSTPSASRKNSIALIHEKKDLSATIDPHLPVSPVRSSIVQREHEYSRSFEYTTSSNQEPLSANTSANDKQSRSFDAVHLLRPGSIRSDAVNRRTKSYETADERRPSTSSIAPPPIIIKIPDMNEIVKAAQRSQIQDRQENINMEEYKNNSVCKAILAHQISIKDHENHGIRKSSQDLWRLRQSYELEEQQLGPQSPEDLSLDLLTSTSTDSTGAMPSRPINNSIVIADDDLSKYQYRRKSSSNLLLPPPEVRRQALRRTFEKRRNYINQSNAKHEQEQQNNQTSIDDDQKTYPIKDFSSLLRSLDCKSENSSFERSLETDFDIQSDTSSRGPNDQFTSIESSGNENTMPDIYSRRHQQQQQEHNTKKNDSGYKSLESQNSHNRTFSLDWMSTDGAESVIYVGDPNNTQKSVDIKDLDEDLALEEQNQKITVRPNPKLLGVGLHRSCQETSVNLAPPGSFNNSMMQQRSLSTNIPLVEHYETNPINTPPSPKSNQINSISRSKSPTPSFIRTASKKRREFGKDKRDIPSSINDSNSAVEGVQQNQTHQDYKNLKPSSFSSSLQVRHPDLRRTKSDGSKNGTLQSQEDPSVIDSIQRSNEIESNAILPLTLNNGGALDPTLDFNSTNTVHSTQNLQRSPSSVTSNQPTARFRSQRNSLPIDTQTSPTNLLAGNTKTQPSTTIPSNLPTNSPKPRFKFSMVRDTAMTSLGCSAPVYSMPITRDYSIDKKTNRIVNEFLMHDPSLDEPVTSNDENSARTAPKRHHHHHHHHHRVRPKTNEEPTLTNNNLQKAASPQQRARSPISKQRYSSFPTPVRKTPQSQNSSTNLSDSIEQDEDINNPSLPLLPNKQQTVGSVRHESSIAAGSPSIIITGDDSGS